jgi:hypothetical protein
MTVHILPLYEGTNIITVITAGHVVRMDQQRPAKRILSVKAEGRRKCEPRLRWEDGVTRNGQIWQNHTTKAVAQKGLLSRS